MERRRKSTGPLVKGTFNDNIHFEVVAKAGSWKPTTNADCKIANEGGSCVGGGCKAVGTISPISSTKRCDEGRAESDLMISWTHFAHCTQTPHSNSPPPPRLKMDHHQPRVYTAHLKREHVDRSLFVHRRVRTAVMMIQTRSVRETETETESENDPAPETPKFPMNPSETSASSPPAITRRGLTVWTLR